MAAYVKTLLDKDNNQVLPNTSIGAVSGLQSRLDSIDLGFGNKIDLTINSSTLKIDLINGSNIISTKTVDLPSVTAGTIASASYDDTNDKLVLTFDTTPDATTVEIPAADLTGAIVRTVNSQNPDANGNIAVSATNVPYSNSGIGLTGTNVQAAVTELSANKAAQTVLGTAWVAGTTYNVDDHVMHNGVMYKCKTANSDATFTSANWTVVDFAKETNDKIDSLSSAFNALDNGRIYINPDKDTWYKGYFDSTGAFIADQQNASPTNVPILFSAGDVLTIKPNGMNVQVRTFTYSGGVYTQVSNTMYTTNQVISFENALYVSIHANKTGVVTITTADITCEIYKDSETKKYIDSEITGVESDMDERIDGFEEQTNEQLEALVPAVKENLTQTIANTDYTEFGHKAVGADGSFYDNNDYNSYIYQFDKNGKFHMDTTGNSSYVFIALYSGYPSQSTFIERKYNGTTPSAMGEIDVTSGQYVFISVNLLTTIAFNTYLDYTVDTQPILFRRKMKIAWFGDSISQLQQLPHRVGNNIGCTVYDCSFAGAALTYGSTRYGGMSVYSLSGQIASGNFSDLETSLDNQEADGIDVTQKRVNAATLEGLNFSTGVTHVVIMGGTNDLNNDYVTTSADLTAFKTAVQGIIDNFNNNFPQIRLTFISDPYRGDITPAKPDKNGHSLIDINAAIQEVCEANNIVFYDLYHASGINANTVGYYLMNDELHQTEAGDILLAEKCAKWLEAN